MSRNLVVYGLAALAGILVWIVLRGLLGGEIMIVLALLGLVVVGVIVFRNLQTNRKVAEASPAERTEALALTPVTGKTVLYIFRNQYVGRAVGINVLIDDREVAQLKSPRFTRLLLSPGAHRFSGYTGTNKKPEAGSGTTIAAIAGEVLVLKCEVEAQMVGVSVKFTQQPIETARKDLQKISRMVTPDVAEI